MSGFESGPLTGRAFKLGDEADWTDLLDAARSAARAGNEEDGFSFCRDVAPFDEDLLDCEHVQGYRASPGPSILWVRRDTRVPTKAMVDGILSEICDVPLGALRSSDREVVRERARSLAVARTSPRTKIVPCLLSGDLLWIGTRTVSADLRRLVSRVVRDDLSARTFPYEPSGFQAVCLASTHLSLSGSQLPNEVSVESVVADVGKGKIRGRLLQDGQLVSVGPAVKVALRESDVVFEELTASMPFRGGTASVSMDQDGPYRVVVPSSSGGIPADRLLRRISDVMFVASKVMSSMQASVEIVG